MQKISTCILFILLLLIFQQPLSAQLRPAIIWEKSLGGTKHDKANDVLINPDGTFIVVGSSNSNDIDVSGHHGSTDSADAWIAKLSADGNIIWQRSFGGTNEDIFRAVIRSNDNGYLCSGYTKSNNGDVSGNHGAGDAWIVKLDQNGNIIWSKCYGGSKYDVAAQIIKTTDGNYAIMGTSWSSDGDVLSGVIGRVTSDGWAFKIDDAGNIIWEKCIDFSGDNDFGYDIIVSEDNNLYVVASTTEHYVGGLWPNQVNLIRTPGKLYKLDNTSGNTSLVATIGGDSSFAMCRTGNALRVSVLQETYFYVEFCYDEDLYILAKPDGSNTLSTTQIGMQFTRSCTNTYADGYYTAYTHGLAAAETSSGLVAAGTQVKENNAWIHKGWLTDINGFDCNYGDAGQFDDFQTYFNSVKVFPSGNDYIVVGNTTGSGGDVSSFHGGTSDCWVVRLAGLNRVVGNVFIDANNNNIKDPGELPFTHGVVKTTRSGGFEQASIPYNAVYSNTVDVGTFTTKLYINRPYYTATPVSKTSVFSTYTNKDSANFAVHPIPGIIDCAVAFTSIPNGIRPGFPVRYNFNYSNRGTTSLTNRNVVFVKDHNLQLINTIPPYTSIVGDSIKWTIASMDFPDGGGNIIVNTELNPIPIVNLGDTLESSVYIDSTADFYKADNFVSLRSMITGGYDPNDKQEIHGSFITPAELDQGDWLNYTIRFQNTGNDTAFNIIIKDTLDSKLNWDSIEVTSSSHPYQFNIKNSKYVTCSFNNIKLADSIHNEPLSHGYITYRIKPKTTVVIGDTIRNTASIYFDFNPAVKTNTQLTIVRTRPVDVLWTGTVSTAWEDPSNWSNGKIPDDNSNVKINTGAPNYPIINSFAICRSLDIQASCSILVKTGYTLKVLH